MVGEGQPFLTALVVLDGDFWPGLAQDCGVDPMNSESLRSAKVIGVVTSRIKAALKDFPGYAKVRKVTLFLEPWTIDNGLLTPTLKVKRPRVIDRFREEVDQMYSDGPAAGDRR